MWTRGEQRRAFGPPQCDARGRSLVTAGIGIDRRA